MSLCAPKGHVGSSENPSKCPYFIIADISKCSCYNSTIMGIRRLSSIVLFLILICHVAIESYADESSCTDPGRSLDHAVEIYKAGRSEEALQIFRDLSEEIDDPSIAGIASLMTGHIMGQLQIDGADAYLERAYTVYPLIGDYASFKLAGLLEGQGEYEKAAGLYKTLNRSYPDSPLQKRALFKAADAYLAAGNLPQAREAYDAYVSVYPGDKAVPSAILGIGTTYLQEEKAPLAIDYFKRVWIEYPASPVSWIAKEKLNSLQELGYEIPPPAPGESYMRGERLYEAVLYADALTEYKRFLSGGKDLSREKEIEAYFKIGMSNYNLRRSEDAEKNLEAFLKHYPGHPRAREALYWLGKTYLRAGKEDAFIKASKRYIKRYKDQDEERIPEILYRLGIVYAGQRDVETAISYYDRVMKEYPNSSFASDSQWANGWLLYKERELKKALTLFDNILQQRKDSHYAPQALYWKARVSERMDDPGEMEKSLCQLCREYPGSFYCLFAMYHDRMDCASPARAVVMDMEGDLSADHYRAGTTEDEQTIRVKLLFHLGFEEEAVEEAQLLRKKMAKDKKKSVSLASLLASMEEYNTALGVISSSFSRDMLYRDQGIDPRVWRLMYPTGYSEMVNRYADENDADPLLLYALIREESWFNRSVVSSAGAVGLMQLMPQTASAVNGSHVDRDSLFDPDINIALGTRFFAGLLRQYDGNMIVALASYNAGPVVVTRWLQERKGFALDEFIEDIPYKETRNYVKKVFTSYMEYLRMAGMGSKAGSGEGERLTHQQ